jgi:hypothetical protein
MQQLHRSVFKPLHQVAQGSTEPTRSLRNSIARLVLTAFGVVIIRRSETKVKRTELKLNVRVGVILSRRKLQGARLPLSCQTELFFNKYKIDPKRLFYKMIFFRRQTTMLKRFSQRKVIIVIFLYCTYRKIYFTRGNTIEL